MPIVVGLTLGSVTASWMVVSSKPESREIRAEYATELTIRQQQTRSRRWTSTVLSDPIVLRTKGPPTLFTVDQSDQVFALDGGDSRVKKYGVNGEIQFTFPPSAQGGRIEGPVTHLATRPDGSVLVAQPAARQVTVIAPSGDSASSFYVTPAVTKIAACGPDVLVAKPAPQVGHWFQLHGLETLELRSTFGTVIKDQQNLALAVDGVLTSSGPYCVFASRYLGLFARVSPSGTVDMVASVINPDPPPRVLITPEGQKRVLQEDVRYVLRSASIRGNQLFTLTTNQDLTNPSIDVYDVESGEYLYSARAPAGTSQFLVGPKYAYTVRDIALTRWTMVLPPAVASAEMGR